MNRKYERKASWLILMYDTRQIARICIYTYVSLSGGIWTRTEPQISAGCDMPPHRKELKKPERLLRQESRHY